MAFDGEGSWNFGNEFATNFLSFSVDNRSSSRTNN